MSQLPLTDELLRVASHIVWFEPPKTALANTRRFLAYLMTYGTLDELAVVRRYLTIDDFRDALEHAPPGVMDERSWNYWNLVTGRGTAPELPRRMPLTLKW